MDSFVQEWINFSQDKGNPFKFISLYIAFNYCYSSERGEKDISQIRSYIKNILEEHKNFNPFSLLDENSELLKDNVISEKYHNSFANHQKLKEKDVQELFKAIYYIRCNLFHGSKSMGNMRNVKLVDEASKILEYLFKEVEND